ncbi:hypothetical protein HPP92_028381, partial [Vanilla planifolia]
MLVGDPKMVKHSWAKSCAVKLNEVKKSPLGASTSVDLGGSSKYSNENFEGRRVERFHVNDTCRQVGRKSTECHWYESISQAKFLESNVVDTAR